MPKYNIQPPPPIALFQEFHWFFCLEKSHQEIQLWKGRPKQSPEEAILN
jgi:hypothetical protein